MSKKFKVKKTHRIESIFQKKQDTELIESFITKYNSISSDELIQI